MKYYVSYLIVLLLYVMCLERNEAEATSFLQLHKSPAKAKPKLTSARNALQGMQRGKSNNGMEEHRERDLFNIGQILDPLLGTPITIKSVVLEILIYPIKQTFVSVQWTNDHIVRNLVQRINNKLNSFYSTYLDAQDLPLFVALIAFALGTYIETMTKFDEFLEKLDTFITDILTLLVAED